jgi:hypothetical protein
LFGDFKDSLAYINADGKAVPQLVVEDSADR